MSMTRRKKHHKSAPPIAGTPSQTSRPVGLLTAVVLTLALGGIPFGLGKYIELNSPDPFDGGAYVYSAQRLLDGARLWVDEHSSALPGTLLCNVLGVKLFGYNDFGPNLIQMLLQLGGLAMLFYAVQRLFGNAAAAVSTILAAVMLSAPVIAKFGNVKEQFMIPFALVSAGALMLHEQGGKKRWALVAGAAAILPYYFKPTGIAIIVATGLYLAVKLAVRPSRWKAVFITVWLWAAGAAAGLCFPLTLFVWQKDVGRFFTGVPVVVLETIVLFAAVGHLLFVLGYTVSRRRLWSLMWSPPYRRRACVGMAVVLAIGILCAVLGGPFLLGQMQKLIDRSGLFAEDGYVGLGRQARSFSDQAPQVFRYYHAVGAAVYPALATVVLAAAAGLYRRVKRHKADGVHGALAGFLAAWWLADMLLVWVSPHSYEQYYLPLCASGAMLTAYAVWLWAQWLKHSRNKLPSVAVGAAAAAALLILLIPVFAGFSRSPDTASAYKDAYGRPERRRGFAQRLNEVRQQQIAPWQAVGDYVRIHSTPDQTLYVWGWFPGIYVRAQRFAPVSRAYESEMHVMRPRQLAAQIRQRVEQFERTPPRFIVDSLKRHFPFDRPPFELWPRVPQGMFGNPQPRLLGRDRGEIEAFEKAYAGMLAERFGDDEAERFEAMKPFRDFVMNRYRPAGQFGSHMLFEYRAPDTAQPE